MAVEKVRKSYRIDKDILAAFEDAARRWGANPADEIRQFVSDYAELHAGTPDYRRAIVTKDLPAGEAKKE